ncbi:YfgM family protein [Paracidovorax anthurii]|uniref:Ancillary SecYEG translocon subunit n=1 Tax=Paracidovorax anthurii TaxID=78229 RepID=A0A328Z164_9BURK|nr:tetratricopeptide repeat protein [Paracidovorax anthurii]RAR76547.1 putative negative regulator of RcsB-dependent stress response [Paracidovorax anthurii]WCM91978.1 tetratricopeptide repeat protein [Acidovorax sp. NCPPB 2350]
MAKHLDLEEQEQIDQLKHFWNAWGTLISGVLVVIFGGIAAWNGYQYWQNRQAGQAAALADAVQSAVQAGDAARASQAFDDLKSRYGGTTQAAQAGLTTAKAMIDGGNVDGAKPVLEWLAQNASDDGYKALAKLRLASVLVDQKSYDDAMVHLSGKFPPQFDAVVADRKGDVLVLQGKKSDAVAEYQKAYKGLEEGAEYRRLIDVKLGSLGVQLQANAVAAEGAGK